MQPEFSFRNLNHTMVMLNTIQWHPSVWDNMHWPLASSTEPLSLISGLIQWHFPSDFLAMSQKLISVPQMPCLLFFRISSQASSFPALTESSHWLDTTTAETHPQQQLHAQAATSERLALCSQGFSLLVFFLFELILTPVRKCDSTQCIKHHFYQ